MCDIVIASDDASFEDTAHFKLADQTPGDGIGLVYTMLLGLDRARYFMLTGQVIGAQEAKISASVSELIREKLLPRAWELADLLLRYTRVALDPAAPEEMDRAGGHVPSRPGVAGELDKENVVPDAKEIARRLWTMPVPNREAQRNLAIRGNYGHALSLSRHDLGLFSQGARGAR